MISSSTAMLGGIGGGFRLGMAHTVVYPPRAAARVPASTVSL